MNLLSKQAAHLLIYFFILANQFCYSVEFPDAGGILDFSNPEKIHDRLFILTNPKSGSHLLLYSIMNITKRPLRGRLPIELFYNDPNCFPPENIMNYELDFTKPTTYWGHEYYLLNKLNRNNNKLIFIIRNYKENIISNIMLNHNLRSIEKDCDLIEAIFIDEIFNNGPILKEYLIRLRLYHEWDKRNRCLVKFTDLLNRPDLFVPQVMEFIQDNSNYEPFIDQYSDFKRELKRQYRKSGNETGSNENAHYFSTYISKKTLTQADRYMEMVYPILWMNYLLPFKEL